MVFEGNPNAEPPLLNGDYNNDGKVDGADYVTWRDNEGGGTALPNDNNLGTPHRRGALQPVESQLRQHGWQWRRVSGRHRA